jgi:hypothetical protein
MENLIKVNTGNLASDVFYGSIRINNQDISVSNLLKEDIVYNFRMTAKAKAGFQCIKDVSCAGKDLAWYISKHTTVVEVERLISGRSYWFHVLTTKGGKWYSIDKAILESITVGDMHQAFSKMIDWNIWNQVNAKTHACKSFVNNKKAA